MIKSYFESLISRGITVIYGLLLLKIFSIYLSQSNFSQYFLTYNLCLYVSTVLFTIQGSIILRFYHLIDNKDLENLIGILNTLAIILMLVFVLIIAIFSFFNLVNLFDTLLILILTITFGFYNNEISYFRIKHQFIKVVYFTLMQSLITLIALFFLRNILNYVYSVIIVSCSYAITFLLFRVKDFKNLFCKVRINEIKKYIYTLNYAIPITLIGLFNFLLSSMTQFFLLKSGHESVLSSFIANYNIAEKSIVVLISVISLVFVPTIFKKYKSLTLETFKDVKKVVTYFTIISIFIVLLLLFISKFLTIILTNPKYTDTSWIIPIVSFGGIFLGINSIISEVLTVQMKTKLVMLCYFVGIFISIILNTLLTPKYGIYGSIFSTIISYLGMMLATLYFVTKEYKKLLV